MAVYLGDYAKNVYLTNQCWSFTWHGINLSGNAWRSNDIFCIWNCHYFVKKIIRFVNQCHNLYLQRMLEKFDWFDGTGTVKFPIWKYRKVNLCERIFRKAGVSSISCAIGVSRIRDVRLLNIELFTDEAKSHWNGHVNRHNLYFYAYRSSNFCSSNWPTIQLEYKRLGRHNSRQPNRTQVFWWAMKIFFEDF